jgi:ABC-type dipeptide/oligopeptide/nickel transport system permease component
VPGFWVALVLIYLLSVRLHWLPVFGLEAAHLMTGGAAVEYVFAWPGIGKMAVDVALVWDMPIVVGFAIAAGA